MALHGASVNGNNKHDKMSEIDEHITKRFDIQKRLGKGAYGIVWKAIDRKTKEIIAVKKIFDAFRNQTDAQRTFREIMFLQSFKNHPNIVKLHSIHRAANNRDIYLGFEYMETDLHNVIKRGNILKDIHKRYIMYQLFKAMKYIHSGNVIHRDLKPSNVLLDSLCRCKIADFGLARSISQNNSESTLTEGDPTLTDYVATRWYRAPEILIANRRYTKGIDMWSLGCILAEMSLGKPIFPGTSTVNQVERIMSTIPVPSNEDIHQVCISGVGSSMIYNASSAPYTKHPLNTLLAQIPSDATDLIGKLLIFNPHKRLTAEQSLYHQYVEKFHDSVQEIAMISDVIIPLNDDVRLSVDNYRNKLYELMSSSSSSSSPPSSKPHHLILKPKIPDVYSKVTKNTEKYIRSHVVPSSTSTTVAASASASTANTDKRQIMSLSEPKIYQKNSLAGWVHHNNTHLNKSDSKVPSSLLNHHHHHHHPGGKNTSGINNNFEKTNVFKAGGDHCRIHMRSNTEVPNKRKISGTNNNNNKSSSFYQSFNSFNKSHGIITQSALMELKSTGLR